MVILKKTSFAPYTYFLKSFENNSFLNILYARYVFSRMFALDNDLFKFSILEFES